MARERRSSFLVTTRRIRLGLVVILGVQCLTATAVTAWERTPFDPVFSPATGQAEKEIAVPLEPKFNETFLRQRAATFVTPSADATPSTDTMMIKKADEGANPAALNTLANPVPAPVDAAEKGAAGAGLFGDLFRLFGFQGAGDSVNEATNEAATPVPASAMPTVPMQAAPVREEKAALEAEPASREQAAITTPDVAAGGKSGDPGLLQNLYAWFRENSRPADLSDDNRHRPRSAVIELPPVEVAEARPPVLPSSVEIGSDDATPEPTAVDDPASPLLPVVDRMETEAETPPDTPAAPGFFSELFSPETVVSEQIPDDDQSPLQTAALPQQAATPQTEPVAPSALLTLPAAVPENALPTIKRKEPAANFFEVISSFFANDTVTQASKTSQPASPPSPAPEEETGTTLQRMAVAGQVPMPSAPSSAQQDAPPTPLVDAAIAEAQRVGVKPVGDIAFAVDIAVPMSDQVRVAESKLVLGDEGFLGRALPFMVDPGEHCVRRLSGQTWICLETLGWPSVIADAFLAKGVSEGRTKAIVRYDHEEATQYRVSFPTGSFDRIRFHLEYLLGLPSEQETVMVSLIAEPKRKSRVIRWIADRTGDKPPAILELREIDDIRWMESPDKTSGVVRLYRAGEKPVFSLITSADLRLIEVRQLANKRAPTQTGVEP